MPRTKPNIIITGTPGVGTLQRACISHPTPPPPPPLPSPSSSINSCRRRFPFPLLSTRLFGEPFLTLSQSNAGKSCHCELLAQIAEPGLKHLSINSIVKERNCYDGYDDELKSHIVDEDKVCFSGLPFFPFFLSPICYRYPCSPEAKDNGVFGWLFSFWMRSRTKSKRAGASLIGTYVICSRRAG